VPEERRGRVVLEAQSWHTDDEEEAAVVWGRRIPVGGAIAEEVKEGRGHSQFVWVVYEKPR
jgi:hypothetical protein